MSPLQTETRSTLWRASQCLFYGRNLARFQHNDATRSQSQATKSKPTPTEYLPRSVGNFIVGLKRDAYIITQVSPWRAVGPVCRTYQAIRYDEEDRKETFLVKELRRGTQTRHVLGANKSFYIHPNLQTVHDAEPRKGLLVYRALPYNMNRLIREHPELPWELRKEILKRALTGLAALHETELIHLNIRPHAVFVDYQPNPGPEASPFRPSNGLYRVQLGGLEDVILPHLSKESINQYHVGPQGLPWKSPEFWIRGLQARPSDVFSFGLAAVNWMLGDLDLQSETGFSLNNLVALGGLGRKVPTPQQLAKLGIWFNYFGDADALKKLLEQVKDEPNQWYGPLSKAIEECTFGTRKLLPGLENHHDLGFVDLVTKMTHLDPSKRITAREALEHEWIANVKVGREYGPVVSPFVPDDIRTDGLRIRKIVPVIPRSRTVVQKDEDKEPAPEATTPVKNLIRKVAIPLSESSLERYRKSSGPTPDPERIRTNQSQLKPSKFERKEHEPGTEPKR
ncbi:putative Serine/Threonine protein kinase [Triangularia verruculosa]|uniref:Serine/Threonine protein kinase n=1 Tax=Triangularia verruculosa TaxID=2587418 RepID=A0AAN7AZQ5_9PEZI|nr:putative Serine/Threonine protein kinase [Triangularia verruculosa]